MEINNIPSGLVSKFYIHDPNSDISLGKRRFVLVGNEGKRLAEGVGDLYLTFTPIKGLKVQADIEINARILEKFMGDNLDIVVEGQREWIITGVSPLTAIRPYVESPPCDNIKRVVFHLVNFCDFVGEAIRRGSSEFIRGRLNLKSDVWKVTLDSTPVTKRNIKLLKKIGGFAITHIGSLERVDGGTFSSEEAKSFFRQFADFIAFTRGLWAAPTLLFGYDKNGKVAWSEMGFSKRLTPWKYVDSWCDTLYAAEMLPPIFSGYMSIVAEPNWKDVLPSIIYWYVLGNTMSFLDGGLVLIQLALELLSWNFLVVEKSSLSQDAFSRISASDKIRLLTSFLGIPLEIPETLTQLTRYAKGSNRKLDGPDVITA